MQFEMPIKGRFRHYDLTVYPSCYWYCMVPWMSTNHIWTAWKGVSETSSLPLDYCYALLGNCSQGVCTATARDRCEPKVNANTKNRLTRFASKFSAENKLKIEQWIASKSIILPNYRYALVGPWHLVWICRMTDEVRILDFHASGVSINYQPNTTKFSQKELRVSCIGYAPTSVYTEGTFT